ncbi:hypothetical protein PGB90_009209 [Kerria lacca]
MGPIKQPNIKENTHSFADMTRYKLEKEGVRTCTVIITFSTRNENWNSVKDIFEQKSLKLRENMNK